MDFPEGMNLVYQYRSMKVPVPGVPYSSMEVSESISYLVSNEEYASAQESTSALLVENVLKGVGEIGEAQKMKMEVRKDEH